MPVNPEEIETYEHPAIYREARKITVYNESLEICNIFLERAKKKKKNIQIAGILLKKSEILLYINFFSRDFREYLSSIKLAEKEIEDHIEKKSSEYGKLKGYLSYLQGIYLYEIDRHTESLSSFEQSMQIFETSNDKEQFSKTLRWLILSSFWSGQVEKGILYSKKALNFLEEYNNPSIKMDVLFTLSMLYVFQGNFKLALKIRRECSTLAKELKYEFVYLGSSKIIEGWLLIYLGKFEEAHQLAFEGLEYVKERDNEWWMFFGYNFLSMVQHFLGKTEESLENALNSLKIAKKISKKTLETMAYRATGDAYRRLGQIDNALENRLKNVELFEFLRVPIHKAFILSDIIYIYVERKNFTDAKKYLGILKELYEQTNNKYVKYRLLMSEALIFMKSSDPRERGKAELLFEQIIENKEIEFEVRIYSLFNLCVLLVIEFQLSGDAQILNKFSKYIEQLLDLSESRNLNYLIVEIYILQSKISLIKMEIEDTKELLKKALKLSETAKFDELSSKIKEEQEVLTMKQVSWRELMKKEVSLMEKATMIERAKDMKIDDTLNSMKEEITTKLFVLKI